MIYCFFIIKHPIKETTVNYEVFEVIYYIPTNINDLLFFIIKQ